MLKRAPHHLLHFTRKEKNGTLLLLFIILLLIATPFIFSLICKEKTMAAGEFKNEMASLKIKTADSIEKKYSKNEAPDYIRKPYVAYTAHEHTLPASLFDFDPNTLAGAGWKKLGVTDKTIATIQNYLSKGGKFHEPADLKKIWGLREELVNRLLPYVKIEQRVYTASAGFAAFDKKEFPKKALEVVDINNADSNAYISLPGIGAGYARRIIKFRDRLGGFYKIDQVAETFGLPDSTFQKIKNYLQVSGDNIKKININTASFDELKEHPYIRYQLANAIIQFRTQHGNFSSVADVKKIILITDEIFEKLSPYLAVE